jgi:hypothetical protein
VTTVGKIQITIELDDTRLGSYQDAQLAMLWHLAQANPAPHGDRAAGELVERIGREVIRRWLQATPPELWRHQGRDHYSQLHPRPRRGRQPRMARRGLGAPGRRGPGPG